MRSFFAFLASLLFLAPAAFALDLLYDVRYSQGPEILVPTAFHGGVGFNTRWEDDGVFPVNVQIGINEKWEAGAKVILGWPYTTASKAEPFRAFLDVGGKYAITPYSALQVDAWIGLNNSEGGGFVLGYTKLEQYTKNFSLLSEARLGVLDAVAGDSGWVKPMIGFYPNFQVAEFLRFYIGGVVSGSVGNLTEDFSFDLMPRAEVGFSRFRLLAEVSIGILLKNNNKNRISLFGTVDL
jgi:hypothetical protein